FVSCETSSFDGMTRLPDDAGAKSAEVRARYERGGLRRPAAPAMRGDRRTTTGVGGGVARGAAYRAARARRMVATTRMTPLSMQLSTMAPATAVITWKARPSNRT